MAAAASWKVLDEISNWKSGKTRQRESSTHSPDGNINDSVIPSSVLGSSSVSSGSSARVPSGGSTRSGDGEVDYGKQREDQR